MAERAFETTGHFFEHIVSPNIEALNKNPDSLQLAFNAVMSLDALIGHIFLNLSNEQKSDIGSDHNLRKLYSDECDEYSILRDAANSYKHAKLDRPSARLKFATQTKVAKLGYGLAAYGVGKYQGDGIVIEMENGETLQALEIIRACQDFLSKKI